MNNNDILCDVVLHRLAKLVKSRTYLDWPENEAERVNFWERLRRNIAEEDRVSVRCGVSAWGIRIK